MTSAEWSISECPSLYVLKRNRATTNNQLTRVALIDTTNAVSNRQNAINSYKYILRTKRLPAGRAGQARHRGRSRCAHQDARGERESYRRQNGERRPENGHPIKVRPNQF